MSPRGGPPRSAYRDGVPTRYVFRRDGRWISVWHGRTIRDGAAAAAVLDRVIAEGRQTAHPGACRGCGGDTDRAAVIAEDLPGLHCWSCYDRARGLEDISMLYGVAQSRSPS